MVALAYKMNSQNNDPSSSQAVIDQDLIEDGPNPKLKVTNEAKASPIMSQK